MAELITKYFTTNTLTIDNLSVSFMPLEIEPNDSIINIEVSGIGQRSATLTWSTPKPTIFKINFLKGLPPAKDECSVENNTYSYNHSKRLTGLQSNTEYSIVVVGITNSGFVFQSDVVTFKTFASTTGEVVKEKSIIDKTSLQTSYKWNIEADNRFRLAFKTNLATEYIKYYFLNQPDAGVDGYVKVKVEQGSVVLELKNPGQLGIYELVLIAGNFTFKDGDELRLQINVVREKSYGMPDIRTVTYPKQIIEADLRPQEFIIEIGADVLNSEGVEVLLKNGGDSNIINDLKVQNNKISFWLYGRDLISTYKRYIQENNTQYNFNFILKPYFYGLNGKTYGISESFNVNVVKTQFTISKSDAIDKLSSAFTKLISGEDTRKDYEDKITFENEKYLYYRVRQETDSSQDSFVITNVAEDTQTFSLFAGKVVKTEFEVNPETGETERVQNTPYSTLVLKFLEPLPPAVQINSIVWVSKQIIPSVVEDLFFTEQEEEGLVDLQPSFNTSQQNSGFLNLPDVDGLDGNGEIGQGWGFESFENITTGLSDEVVSGSISTIETVKQFYPEKIVNQILSSSKTINLRDLNIGFLNKNDNIYSSSFIQFSNFINFSSAETRLNNFQYKLQSIEFYNEKISSSLYVGNTPSTSSYALLTSQSLVGSITEIKNGFDGFEQDLYETYNVTSSNDIFFTTQSIVAAEFDRNNKNYIIRHIPDHFKESEESAEFISFLELIGQHFDVLWAYIKGIESSKRITHKSDSGINDYLVYHLLKNLGWNPTVPFKDYELTRELFGITSNGTPYSGNNQIGTQVNSGYTIKEARNQVWRRILNNIPYILKNKGTKKAIQAIMSCYGIPESLLTIVEFGGPKINADSTTKYTYEDRTAAINVSETESITIPWVSSSAYVPTSVQTRFKTSYKIPTTTSVTGSQLLRKDRTGGGYWQLNVVPNFTSSFGDVVFTLKNSAATETISLSVTQSVLFDDYWKNVTVQKERFVSNSINYDRFDLYVQEGLDDRIIMDQSATAIHTASAVTNIFTDTGTLYINAYGGTKGISGSLDEIRLWNSALSESVVTAHSLNPDVIYGNGIYSSTDNLLLRLDFEWPKDRIADPYIKNVSPSITFSGSKAISGYMGYATASITTVATSYPYQYTTYERSVTATIPAIGFVPSDKTRFEDIELITDLSHKARATKKAYDRAPIDSNRLGLFFSPVKELNLDILKSLGPINIGDYIGDWQDEYGTDRYKDLDSLRNYYFKRTNLSFEEYIKLIKSIDKSIFDMFAQVIPARAKVTKGLLLEPSLLERSKVKINKPSAWELVHTGSIKYENIAVFNVDYKNIEGIVDIETDKKLDASLFSQTASISFPEQYNISSEVFIETSSINVSKNILFSGNITKNFGSSMAGIEVEIDTRRETDVTGEYDQELGYEAAGTDEDSPFNKGFGLVGENGFVDRTYFRNDGTLVLTERNNAYLLTVKYTRDIPSTNLSGVTTYEKISKYKKKLVLVARETASAGSTVVKSATAHSFYSTISTQLGTYPYDKGVITEIYPFDGLTYGHYRFVGDLTKGLENSFYAGSKQTSLTTIDGTPPVETFATNPNRLKVSDTGRGSGEPILEVD